MATLKVWTDFSKRKNSTKQPTGGTEVDVKLKENCSIENPVFIVNNLGNANYCQYAGNYYFVDDVIFVTNSVVELHCSMDSLATNKTSISNYNCFVERASSLYDPLIVDNALSQKSTGTYTTGTPVSIPHINATNGLYVVRVLGKNTNGITGYIMKKADVDGLLQWSNNFSNFPEIFQGLDPIVDGAVMGVYNPDKFIVSIMWFPFETEAITLGGLKRVYLGNFDTQTIYNTVGQPKVVLNTTVALPTAIYPNDFRKYDNSWSKNYMYLPCVGTIEIDPSKFPNGVGVKYITDLYTGSLTVLLADADNNVPVMKFDSSIGVNVQIGKVTNNTIGISQAQMTQQQNLISGTTGSVATMAGSIATGNVGGVISSIGGISNTATQYQKDSIEVSKAQNTPLMTTIGGVGTIASIQAQPNILTAIYAYDTCENANTYGRPLMKNMQLGLLSGYIKCFNASLSSIANGREKDEINAFLNGGFYME